MSDNYEGLVFIYESVDQLFCGFNLTYLRKVLPSVGFFTIFLEFAAGNFGQKLKEWDVISNIYTT